MTTPETVRLGSGEMFDGIAPRYDAMNRLISLGIDQRWRARTVDALALGPGARVLDLATGTADLAIMIAKRHPDATVVGVDPSRGMLSIGEKKIAPLAGRVTLEVGDAEHLQFDDASFDAVSIAFGIRNVPDRARALAEMVRVTKPGGRIAILELVESTRGLIAPLARFHVHRVVPTLGAWLSGSREYRYLEQSIARFPSPEAFAKLMSAAGMQDVEVHPMTFSVCALFVGRVPVR